MRSKERAAHAARDEAGTKRPELKPKPLQIVDNLYTRSTVKVNYVRSPQMLWTTRCIMHCRGYHSQGYARLCTQ
uniref:Uncharacterized protein n=1 Tax=Hyaloperonospora arabidopsidis (strain Emoy2) TaxID=559515 RepID=M4C4F5_HYAAE